MTTNTIDRTLPITDCQVASFIAPGETAPSQVVLVLTVSGIEQPLALRIKSQRGLQQLVAALMKHGEEAFKYE